MRFVILFLLAFMANETRAQFFVVSGKDTTQVDDDNLIPVKEKDLFSIILVTANDTCQIDTLHVEEVEFENKTTSVEYAPLYIGNKFKFSELIKRENRNRRKEDKLVFRRLDVYIITKPTCLEGPILDYKTEDRMFKIKLRE